MLVLKASPADLPLMTALVRRVVEISDERDDALALRIANAVGRLLGGE